MILSFSRRHEQGERVDTSALRDKKVTPSVAAKWIRATLVKNRHFTQRAFVRWVNRKFKLKKDSVRAAIRALEAEPAVHGNSALTDDELSALGGVARALVAAGTGVTIADEITARSTMGGDVVMLPLDPPLTFDISLMRVAEAPLSLDTRRFATHLGNVVRDMVDKG